MERSVSIAPYQWKGPYADMRTARAAKHDDGLCAEVRAAWMSSRERLIIRSSEIVGFPQGYLYDDHLPVFDPEGRGKTYQHRSFQWDATRTPTALSASCRVEKQGTFSLQLVVNADSIDIDLSVRNDMGQSMGPIDWSFCVIGFECPVIGDPELKRTSIFDGQRLRTLRELSGAAECELYLAAGGEGFCPPAFKTIPFGPITPQSSVIIVESSTGNHAVALGFERSYLIYSNPLNMCFHADPYLGTLPDSGDESHARGKLYLIEGNADVAFARYSADFSDS